MPFIERCVTYLWCLVIFWACGENMLPVKGEQTCSLTRLDFKQCKPNEACASVDSRAVCQCRKDFERHKVDGSCQPVPKEPIPSPSPNASSTSDSGGFGFKLVLWLLIPVLLAVIIGGIFYTGRQKMWLNRLYRMRVRSYNNVLVSSQDEDDPPMQ